MKKLHKRNTHPPDAPAELSSDRRNRILSEAGRLFAKQGFDRTSMREIAAAVDVKAASLYHHFESKEKLYSAVHEAGINTMHEAVTRAIDGIEDPWERLIAAAETHCAVFLEPKGDATIANYAGHMRGLVPVVVPSNMDLNRRQLVAARNRYEAVFEDLVASLKLRNGVDRSVFRLQLLSGLTGMLSWYRKSGRFTPRQLARQYVEMLVYGASDEQPRRSRRGKAANENRLSRKPRSAENTVPSLSASRLPPKNR